MLKDYLDGKNIPYTEKLIDIDEKALEEMDSQSGGFSGVPFTVITLDNGTKETIVGFDKGKLDSIVIYKQ